VLKVLSLKEPGGLRNIIQALLLEPKLTWAGGNGRFSLPFRVASTRRIKAISRLLGQSDVATTLKYYVRGAFSDEEFFIGV
jgi:hypothetical protein